eukprot:1129764-Rhodomonas_salina.2
MSGTYIEYLPTCKVNGTHSAPLSAYAAAMQCPVLKQHMVVLPAAYCVYALLRPRPLHRYHNPCPLRTCQYHDSNGTDMRYSPA